MEIQEFTSQVCSQNGFSEILKKIDAGDREINLKGVVGSLAGALAAETVRRHRGIHLFVFNNSDSAAMFYSDLYKFINPKPLLLHGDDNNTAGDTVVFLPSSFKRSSKYEREDISNIVMRTQVFERLKNSPDMLAVVTFPEALAETVPSNEAMMRNSVKLDVGDKTGIDFLRELFNETDFKRADFVYEPGQYAVRGGIVDVFSFSSNKPCRIEFFGDEIESIRSFDVDSQLSDEKLKSVVITPNIKNIESEKRIPLLDFVPKETVVWTENHALAADTIDSLHDRKHDGEEIKLPELVTGNSFISSLASRISVRFKSAASENPIIFDSHPQPAFNKNFNLLADDIKAKTQDGYKVFIASENPKQIERLKNIFASISKNTLVFSSVSISLSEGFVDKTARICCYTDHKIFQRYNPYRIRGGINRNSYTLQELSNLNVGDYVVHVDHGIGIFGGLVKTETGGKTVEMVRIKYRDDDTVLVNLQGLHRISKYRGQDGAPPVIHKPGSGVWSRLKQTAKKKIKDIASELIALYAERKTSEGFSFSPDSFMQHELEASFIYEDTPDQLKATDAVKRDMESPCPMDRLICGDVGFGKTEIAIRAAFKAAADGKQVAVLVPTTILALQHYKSFKARLNDFPVEIDFVSRMKSAKEIKISLENLKSGKTDIIIGTHRLLSADVAFKDAGLLVIDEEQRFGVSAKEKIRRKKSGIDTLTLTATPIPRTLQFSMLGARDLSLINTPPPNRIPVATEVHAFSEIIIRDAVESELKRGGQVFLIHNRIKDIGSIENIVKRTVPSARTVVAHGKTESARLEEIMTDFVDGLYDVLIATAIIESGLDIPNANTIIINQAQNFGLSELHQLRGRVGRSNRKAYCYLLAPPEAELVPEARRKLKAIEEFSDIGSGFGIALRDLDIRGAGNLLGGEQSGFITEIGFETYQKILDEAIAELRLEANIEGGELQNGRQFVSDAQIDSDIDACLPDSYVSSKSEKLRLYRLIDSIENEERLGAFRSELRDRFGELPGETEELLQGVRLRRHAVKLGFERVALKNGLMFLHFPADEHSLYYSAPVFHKILHFINNKSKKFVLKDSDRKLRLLVREIKSHKEAADILEQIENYESPLFV